MDDEAWDFAETYKWDAPDEKKCPKCCSLRAPNSNSQAHALALGTGSPHFVGGEGGRVVPIIQLEDALRVGDDEEVTFFDASSHRLR